jgi:hypothetical protein
MLAETHVKARVIEVKRVCVPRPNSRHNHQSTMDFVRNFMDHRICALVSDLLFSFSSVRTTI